MKKEIPLILTFGLGLIFLIQYFIPAESSVVFYQTTLNAFRTFRAGILFLGLISLGLVHLHKVQHKKENWIFSLVLLGCIVVMAAIGIYTGYAGGKEALNTPGTLFFNIYLYIQVPIQATLFALLAFYIASASYRAFRIRSILASVLMVAALLVMLGRVPIGLAISPYMPAIATWILHVPNLGAQRAINFGLALGGLSVTLKIWLGIERSYMGGQ